MAAEPTQKSHHFPSSQLNWASTVTEQFMTIFIKEHWATPNRATPKSCYPFKNLNKSKKTQQFKNTLKRINPTIQKETRNLKKTKKWSENKNNKNYQKTSKMLKRNHK